MTKPALSARWRAVHDLQERRSAFPVNSLPSRIADHASVLALSHRRAATPYLAHNALRDARIIVLRRDQLDQRRFPKPFYGTAESPDGLDIRHEVAGFEPTVEPSEFEAGENDCEWKAQYHRIRAALAAKDLRLAEVFDDWRDGVTVEDCAARLGISTGYVKKMRLAVG
ncbi:MAG: hypothetical protein K0M78_13200, partial [Brevundimonas sp.]|nr:hypothetical protein [Brevundimonas sp.]